MKPICVALAVLMVLGTRGQTPDTARMFRPEALRADLDTLYRQLRANHPALFAYRSAANAEAGFQTLRRSLDKPMTRLGFLRLVSPFVAGFNDGHTYVETAFDDPDIKAYEARGGRFFPALVTAIDERLFVSDVQAAPALQTGDEILTINGQHTAALLKRLAAGISADEYRTALVATARLFSLQLWLYTGWGTTTDLTVLRDGRKVALRLPGITMEAFTGLLFGGTNRQLHLYPEEKLAVIEIRQYSGLSRARTFIDSCFRIIRDSGYRHVALDLRRNGGGNSAIGNYVLAHVTRKPFATVSRKSWRYGPIMQALDTANWRYPMLAAAMKEGRREGDAFVADFEPQPPEALADTTLLVPVPFYLLTSGRTYSSAHMTALSVKCGGLGTIIGQPTGERLDLTGEIAEFRLPNTGLSVWVPTALFTSACGRGSQVGVDPDHRVETRTEDLRRGRDPELSFLRALIRKKEEALGIGR